MDIDRQAQRRHFDEPEAARFRWLTTHPHVAARERDLLRPVAARLAGCGRLLEVGCGEGANLVNLGPLLPAGTRVAGVDFCPRKVAFAARSGAGPAFAAADAGRLPFADGAFDAVLFKDVVHHLDRHTAAAALAEAGRVLRPGGQCFMLEGDARRAFILFVFSLLVPEERGMLRTSPAYLSTLASSAGLVPGPALALERASLFRLLLHYRHGFPRLPANGLLRAWEACWAALPVLSPGSYVFLEATRTT